MELELVLSWDTDNLIMSLLLFFLQWEIKKNWLFHLFMNAIFIYVFKRMQFRKKLAIRKPKLVGSQPKKILHPTPSSCLLRSCCILLRQKWEMKINTNTDCFFCCPISSSSNQPSRIPESVTACFVIKGQRQSQRHLPLREVNGRYGYTLQQ